MKLPVLIYHKVTKEGRAALAPHEAVYTLSVDEFEFQMGTVAREGFRTPALHELPRLLQEDEKASKQGVRTLMLTFDDGTEDHYHTVYPILKRLGLKGVFFVVTGRVGQPGYVTWPQLREMSDAGMDIESHSHTHPFLTEFNAEETLQELLISKKLIEDRLGKPADSFGVPGGFFNQATLAIADQVGYRYVCTSRWGINSLTADLKVLRRISIMAGDGQKLFRAALDGREAYIWMRRMVRVPLSIPKRILGPTQYARFRRWILALTHKDKS